MLRSSVLIVVAVWLCLATAVFADDEPDVQGAPAIEDQQSAPAIEDQQGTPAVEDQQGTPAVEDQAPSGPILQPADYAPLLCDPSYPGFRYLEVRGVGFDAWATQRLVGNVVDANGVPRIHWNSIWVSPRGQLTLEVNLCTDPFRNRPALPVGDYTVSVGPASGAPIVATTISVSPPVAE